MGAKNWYRALSIGAGAPCSFRYSGKSVPFGSVIPNAIIIVGHIFERFQIMETVSNNVGKMADNIGRLFKELLLQHSSIYERNAPRGSVIAISAYGDCQFRDLGEEGRQLQVRLIKEYHQYYSLLSVLLKGLPKDSQRQIEESNETLLRIIEQQNTWYKTTKEAYEKSIGALQAQMEFLKHLYDCSEGEYIFIPDTNALYHNSNLEKWLFDNIECYTLILLSTVLSELDDAKNNHHNERLREKAETIIRKIKDYGRRGNILECVPIVTGKIYLQAIAIEPKMEESLSWLDSKIKDDRIIAGVLEIMHNHPRTSVVLVTRDINLQNKAGMACIPFVEPPEP